MNYQSKSFTLFHKRTLIGTITNIWTDQPWFHGDIELTEKYEKFREAFEYVTKEDSEEASRMEEMQAKLDWDNWFVKDTDGCRTDVWVYIYPDNTVAWRM